MIGLGIFEHNSPASQLNMNFWRVISALMLQSSQSRLNSCLDLSMSDDCQFPVTIS